MTTNIDLADDLEKLNGEGQYTWIIRKARDYQYHDVLKPEITLDPKQRLLRDLYKYPELNRFREAVIKGDYNETQQQEDDVEILLIN